MIRFLVGVILAALSGVVYAVAAPFVPYAQAILIAAILFAVVVYIAAAYGAPRAPLISHIYGLSIGVLAIWCSWVVWTGAISGGESGDFGLMLDASLRAAQFDHEMWQAHVRELSQTQSFTVSEFNITGDKLLYFWIAEAALVLLAGLIGGHSGRHNRY